MKPVVQLVRAPQYRRCYGCGSEAHHELSFGHTDDDGRNGNTHALAMCDECRRACAIALVSAEFAQ